MKAAILRWASLFLLSLPAATARGWETDAEVQRVLKGYRSARPTTDELMVYSLDWAPTLGEAKKRAAREGRPILLAVVTNSFGNLYTGHC